MARQDIPRQHDILYVIASQSDPYGLAIKGELEKYYENEINHGRLYPNLDEVVDKGLVEKGQLDRRTNYYAITDEGEQIIEDRRELESQYID
ncbi:PadR family transcriptional regulator (plasmid) [Natrinema zhouii]|uniref:PadR family transcriptional regulator n=1 Tax=Natrinema zhouii TaxID=1710539 RepID=UPI001CFF8AB6|nr:helix-turn-helix transcriptional regulator [Natrinema zhouii]UHQ99125.1 PadR family transcriptional regulator [Natrinema zhouii]